MQVGLDPFALLVAVLALWYGIRESRRNNCVILKVKDCSYGGHQSVDENSGRPFAIFRLLLRNAGIPLYDVHVQLTFQEEGGWGLLQCPLTREGNGVVGNDQFQRGMVAEFCLKSYEQNEGGRRFLSRLKDPTKQRAAFAVYSQGYLAKVFLAGGMWDRCKSRWNRIAETINGLFEREIGKNPEGQPVVTLPRVLPVFATLGIPVERLTASLRRELESRAGK
jgi:hypothetical protein